MQLNGGAYVVSFGSVIALAVALLGFSGPSIHYFPASFSEMTVNCAFGPEPVVSDFEAEWYSRAWTAAREPALWSAAPRPTMVASYRFTLLPTWDHPIIVRVDRFADGAAWLTAKELSGEGGYDAGVVARTLERPLTSAETTALESLLATTNVLSLPSHDCNAGTDGSRWILEANEGRDYRYVNRWSPKQGPMRDVGKMFLALTGWR